MVLLLLPDCLIKTAQAYEDQEQQAETDEQSQSESLTHNVQARPTSKPNQVADFNPSNQDHQANRQQDLKLLGQIEEYFAENEPHSPVTFLIKRAINWADMPLDQWLAQVIKNPDQLSALSEVIGIDKPHDSEPYNDGY